jgi:hypothetical protein
VGEQQRGGGQRDQGRSPRPVRLGRRGDGGQQRNADPRQLQWLGFREGIERLDRRPAQREQHGRHRGLQPCPPTQPNESSEEREQAGQKHYVDREERERPNADDADDGRIDEPVGREEAARLRNQVEGARPPSDHLVAGLQRQTVVEEPELW